MIDTIFQVSIVIEFAISIFITYITSIQEVMIMGLN